MQYNLNSKKPFILRASGFSSYDGDILGELFHLIAIGFFAASVLLAFGVPMFGELQHKSPTIQLAKETPLAQTNLDSTL